MTRRARITVFAALFLVLPVCVFADAEEPAPEPAVAAEAGAPETGLHQTLANGTVAHDLLGAPDSVNQSCAGYTCPFCPFIIDKPKAICVNGCCVYEYDCGTTCIDALDCGAPADCWGGCCFYYY
jgi:hypothetical protein